MHSNDAEELALDAAAIAASIPHDSELWANGFAECCLACVRASRIMSEIRRERTFEGKFGLPQPGQWGLNLPHPYDAWDHMAHLMQCHDFPDWKRLFNEWVEGELNDQNSP